MAQQPPPGVTLDIEVLKAIGAAVGIAIAAVSSTVAALVTILRYRREDRHCAVRLKVWQPLPEDPRDVMLTASVFNQGRPMFIDDMYLYLGKHDWMSLENASRVGDEAQRFPRELPTGRSYRVQFQLTRFEADYEGMTLAMDEGPIRYEDEDLPRMRLLVLDGEGHEHPAVLKDESLRNMRTVVKTRSENPYKTVELKKPGSTKNPP